VRRAILCVCVCVCLCVCVCVTFNIVCVSEILKIDLVHLQHRERKESECVECECVLKLIE